MNSIYPQMASNSKKSNNRLKKRVFLIVFWGAFLLGCGQMGPLYLPQDTPNHPTAIRAEQNEGVMPT